MLISGSNPGPGCRPQRDNWRPYPENELVGIDGQKRLPYSDFLGDLLGVEVAARRERYLQTRTRLAHFPFLRPLESFDFAFQPSIAAPSGVK